MKEGRHPLVSISSICAPLHADWMFLLAALLILIEPSNNYSICPGALSVTRPQLDVLMNSTACMRYNGDSSITVLDGRSLWSHSRQCRSSVSVVLLVRNGVTHSDTTLMINAQQLLPAAAVRCHD